MPDDAPNTAKVPKKVTIATQPFAGFAVESANEGESVRVLHKLAVTADDLRFYVYVNQISDELLQKAGVDGDYITYFFITQRADGGADVYTDYQVVVQAQVTRAVNRGEPVFVTDISAIKSYQPQGLTIRSDDVVICVMKVGWKYGLFFDASRKIEPEGVWQQLGKLYQQLQVDRVLANIQGNWSGRVDRLRLDQVPAGIHGRPAVSLTRASKKRSPCLAAVDK